MRTVFRTIFLRPVRCLCIAGLILAATNASAVERFFSVIDDLPLMAQLGEVPESAVVYSKPQGRIVEVAAQGAVTRDAVLSFYAATLPQLGWSRGEDNTWHREDERLSLSFEDRPGGLTVQFSLSPR